MFRFSLGLSFLDDKYIPRVAGIVLGTLLLVNHWLSSYTTPAQQVSEVVSSVMAMTCIVVPTVDSRLQELKGGRRAASQPAEQRAKSVFLLDDSVARSEENKQEIAWASYALLRNTNATSLLLVQQSTILCARGLWNIPSARSEGELPLDSLQREIDRALGSSQLLRDGLSGAQGESQVYLPTFKSSSWGLQAMAEDAACMLVQRVPGGEAAGGEGEGRRPLALLLLSDSSRAFSARDRVWVESLGKKLVQLSLSWP